MKDMNFQIDRVHGAPSTVGEISPYYGSGVCECESQEQWRQREDLTDFQRGKHDSYKGFVRIASHFSITMMEEKGAIP